jgi:hypothetical protein
MEFMLQSTTHFFLFQNRNQSETRDNYRSQERDRQPCPQKIS